MEDSMKARAVMFCFAIALAISAYAADTPSSGKLKGTVADSTGAIISSATVIIHRDWPEGNTQDLRLTTDKAGGFSVELVPGFYDVAIFAHAFSPNSANVRIRTSQATYYTAKLQVSPQWIAEFGDRFVENPVPVEPVPNSKP
jgi:hypothetical protein